MIRVLLVDQNALMRKGMQAHLRYASGIRVVGVAGTGTEVVNVAVQTSSQVVVIDCGLTQGGSARVVARQILKALPSAKLIGLCDSARDSQKIVGIFSAGAAGVIEKAEACQDLSRAIRAVYAGEFYLGHSLVRAVMVAFMAILRARTHARVGILSKREAEIYRRIREGASSKTIACDNNLSKRTVDTYRSRIRNKLGQSVQRRR